MCKGGDIKTVKGSSETEEHVQRVPMLKVGVVFLSLSRLKKEEGGGGYFIIQSCAGGIVGALGLNFP